MKTTSEREFERFLTENGLPFERVEEQPTRRPDYLVQIGDAKVFFEVKEISEDEDFAAPSYKRAVCEGREFRTLRAGGFLRLRLYGHEAKSRSNPHSPVLLRFPREGRNDSCSIAIVPANPPIRV